IWLPRRGHSRVEKRRDMRMREAAKDTALPLEALFAAFSDERDVEGLDRYSPVKSSVAPLRQPDAAHAALTDLRPQSVHAERVTGQTPPAGQPDGVLFEKALLRQLAVFLQEPFE